VNHKSNLQGIPFRKPDSRQTRLPQRPVSRFQIKDLGVLHGRQTSFQRGGLTGGAVSRQPLNY
jgi:hypothetical protein